MFRIQQVKGSTHDLLLEKTIRVNKKRVKLETPRYNEERENGIVTPRYAYKNKNPKRCTYGMGGRYRLWRSRRADRVQRRGEIRSRRDR